jgi:hypothetical protein
MSAAERPLFTPNFLVISKGPYWFKKVEFPIGKALMSRRELAYDPTSGNALVRILRHGAARHSAARLRRTLG